MQRVAGQGTFSECGWRRVQLLRRVGVPLFRDLDPVWTDDVELWDGPTVLSARHLPRHIRSSTGCNGSVVADSGESERAFRGS